jgi:subtilisin-like proprotein convertase family protein
VSRKLRRGLGALVFVGLAAVLLAGAGPAGGAEHANDTNFLIAGSKNAAGFGLVRVFADNDLNGTYETLVDEVVPYSATIGGTDGVRVAAADFDGDGNDELVTASPDNAPVKIYDLSPSGEVGALSDSAAGFTQGTCVAAGDINGDGRDELILGADPGGEPKVKIYADTTGDGRLESVPTNNFNAYAAAGNTAGVRVAAGDTDNDGNDEVITGPGPGPTGVPVKIFDDTDLDYQVSDNPIDDSFLPYDAAFGGGTYVATGPLQAVGSDAAEVVVAPASGQNRKVVIRTDTDADGKVSDNPVFDQLPPPYGATFANGVRVAAGDTDHSGLFVEVVTAPGSDAGSKPVKIYDDDGDPGSLLSDSPVDDQFSAFPGTAGVFVAVASTLVAVYADIHTPLPLPDLTTTTTTIQVPRSAGIIRDVDVFLGISHTNDADLDASLKHEGGGVTTVISLLAGAGHNDDGFIVWLSDEAGTDISAAPDAANDAPVAGTYRSAGPLGAFENEDASGKWTLSITDVSGGDTGTLQQWTLKIRY